MKIRNRFLTELLGRLAVRLIRLLFFTCRKVIVTEAPNTNAYTDTGEDRYLYCLWHDQVVMTLFMKRPVRMSGLVSRHQDGGYVAAAMRARGVEIVRGSSSRGGAGALRGLMDVARTHHVAITPDGPRGPRRKLKSGIAYLASQTGRKILATAYTAGRTWHIRGSWTDMMLPRPFTTIYVYVALPIEVPADVDRDAIAEFTERIQQEMERVERCAEALAAGEELPPGPAEADDRSERLAA